MTAASLLESSIRIFGWTERSGHDTVSRRLEIRRNFAFHLPNCTTIPTQLILGPLQLVLRTWAIPDALAARHQQNLQFVATGVTSVLGTARTHLGEVRGEPWNFIDNVVDGK
jgi:hypothetical protein